MQTRNSFALTEGQSVTFVLRTPLDEVQAVILEQCDKQERTLNSAESLVTVTVTKEVQVGYRWYSLIRSFFHFYGLYKLQFGTGMSG